MSKFSVRLKELRTNRGISQQLLATTIGMSKSSINMYERGEREPGLETLEVIADYFNVDIDYLIGKSDIPNRALEILPHSSPSPQSNDDKLKVALFGGDGEVTDEMWDEVKRFAEFVKSKQKGGK